jgi:hypothetical protein
MFDTPAGLAVRPEGRALVGQARAAGLRTGLLTSKLVAFLSREVVARSDLLSSFPAGSFGRVRRRLGL